MASQVPVWHVSGGGYCLAVSGLILTDLVTGGKTGVTKIAEKTFGSVDNALAILGYVACGFLGGGSVIEMANQGTVITPESIKAAANATIYPAAVAMGDPRIKGKFEKAIAAFQAWRNGESDNTPQTLNIENQGATLQAIQLSTFALGHAAIMAYGAAAGNSALQSAGAMFTGAVISLVAIAMKPNGKRARTGNPLDVLDARKLSPQQVDLLNYYNTALAVGQEIQSQQPALAR